MDMLLGSLALAAIIFGQVAAIVTVHGERKRRQSDASNPLQFDHRTKLIWNFGS
jgi:3-deoxy-D-arabino-heptulosonate 7-phosphate (DAHP) synthase